MGLRYSPTPNSDIVFSHIESERSEQRASIEILPVLVIDAFDPFAPPLLDAHDTDIEKDDEGSQSEIQYLLKGKKFNLVAGMASAEIDTVTQTSIVWSSPVPPAFPVLAYIPIAEESTEVKTTLEHDRARRSISPLASVPTNTMTTL